MKIRRRDVALRERRMPHRVLLVNPGREAGPFSILSRASEPAQIIYLAGALEKRVEVTLVDLQLGYGDIKAIAGEFALKRYWLAGIAIPHQSFLGSAVAVARQLKDLSASTPVFALGLFASLNADWLLEAVPVIDFAVVDEAETFVEELFHHGPQSYGMDVRRRFQGRPPGACPLVTRLVAPRSPAVRTLTSLVIEKGGMPSMLGSHGCGGSCTFCCTSSYCGSQWQPRDIEDICRELRGLVERFGVTRFDFADMNLLGHVAGARRWVARLSQALRRFDPPLGLKTSCRMDDLDEEIVPVLRGAGFAKLKIGVETFCENSQRAYEKRIPMETAAGKLDLLRKAGMDVSLQMIMFDPYAEMADLERNLDFLLEYPDYWGRSLLATRLLAYRGTRIEQRLEEDGLAVSRGIRGTAWRFRHAEVADVYRRFASLLRAELLETERRLRLCPYPIIRSRPQELSELEALLQECWIGLFRRALGGGAGGGAVQRALGEARRRALELCENN